jgi:hypothetical protein
MIEHVDPFIGNATDLPEPQGLAASWWWPKPQIGNTPWQPIGSCSSTTSTTRRSRT